MGCIYFALIQHMHRPIVHSLPWFSPNTATPMNQKRTKAKHPPTNINLPTDVPPSLQQHRRRMCAPNCSSMHGRRVCPPLQWLGRWMCPQLQQHGRRMTLPLWQTCGCKFPLKDLGWHMHVFRAGFVFLVHLAVSNVLIMQWVSKNYRELQCQLPASFLFDLRALAS